MDPGGVDISGDEDVARRLYIWKVTMAHLLVHFYSLRGKYATFWLHVQLIYSVPPDDTVLNAEDGMWSVLIGYHTIMYLHIFHVYLKKTHSPYAYLADRPVESPSMYPAARLTGICEVMYATIGWGDEPTPPSPTSSRTIFSFKTFNKTPNSINHNIYTLSSSSALSPDLQTHVSKFCKDFNVTTAISCIARGTSVGCVDNHLELLDPLAPTFNTCSCMRCACLQHEYGSTLGGGMVAFNFGQDNAWPAYGLHMYFVPLHGGSKCPGVLLTPHVIWIFLLRTGECPVLV